MKLGFLDFETLRLAPREPGKMPVDSAALLVCELDAEILRLFKLTPYAIQAYFLGDSVKAFGVSFFPAEREIMKLHSWNFAMEEQYEAGRVADQSTIDWHLKNGYDVAAVADRQSVRGVLEEINQRAGECDVVFCRGMDFDVTLFGNLLVQYGIKEVVKHRRWHDTRSAIDELFDDLQYEGIYSKERVDALDLTPAWRKVFDWSLEYCEELKVTKHQAGTDVLLDAVAYFMLKGWRRG